MRALVAVAHGSPQPEAQHTVDALLDLVREQVIDAQVHGAYVQNAEPSLSDVLGRTGPDAVVVPLLLSRGHHVTNDVAGVAHAAAVHVTAPLGPDPALCDVLLDRLGEAGAPIGVPVVLAAAGSADPCAAADVERQAQQLARRAGAPVLAAYVSAARPTVDEAICRVLTTTGRPAAVAPYLIGAGHFHDQVRQAAATWVAEPLGAHPVVASLVARRYYDVVGTGAAS